MIQIIKYEELENDINVGFRKHNFIVYGSIGKEEVEGLSRKEILQKVYEIIKPSLDYETNRYNQGLSNSIVDNSSIYGTEEEPIEPEEFIPEPSKVVELILNVDRNYIEFNQAGDNEQINIETGLINQYGEVVIDSVELSVDYGTIINNKLILEPINEPREIVLTASYGNISKSININLEPYSEPIAPQPTPEELRIQSLENELNMQKMAMDEVIFYMIPSLMEGGK